MCLSDPSHTGDNYPGTGGYHALDGYPHANGTASPSGVGIGKMWMNTGSNPYYRWSSCAGPQHFIDIKIGRMLSAPQN